MGMQFDQWLEEELKRGFRHAGSRPLPVPRYASLPHLLGRSPIVHAIATAARSKVAIAATALTLAAGGTVGAKAAVTGNPNPFNWGQQVKQKVVTCKQDLKPGEHGIGQCRQVIRHLFDSDAPLDIAHQRAEDLGVVRAAQRIEQRALVDEWLEA